jgi:hypothetical protein
MYSTNIVHTNKNNTFMKTTPHIVKHKRIAGVRK